MEQGARNKFTICVAAESDAAAVAQLMTELNEAVGASGLAPGADRAPENVIVSEEQARRRLRAMASVETALLAEVDGVPAGLVSVRIVPYLSQDVLFAEVTELYVTPSRRRLGIARSLMTRAEEMARAQGCTSVHVIAAQSNAEAISFYRAVGYGALYVGFEKFL